MTIHVKQHTRIVNGKLVIVHEHQKQGGGVHHEIIQPEEVHDEFSSSFGDHHHQQEVNHEHTDDDYEGAFSHIDFDKEPEVQEEPKKEKLTPGAKPAFNDLKVGMMLKMVFTDDIALVHHISEDSVTLKKTKDGHAYTFTKTSSQWDDMQSKYSQGYTLEKPKKGSNPTVAEMLGIGGQEWKKNGNDRIYFNGLHEHLEGVSKGDLKGSKVYFDIKSGEFHTKNLDEETGNKIIEAIKKKAKEWGTKNVTFTPDPAAVDSEPQVGDKGVPLGKLKVGMVFENEAGFLSVTKVFGDEVGVTMSYKNGNPDQSINIGVSAWGSVAPDFTLKEIRPVATKPHYDPGSTVPFEHLQEGMEFKTSAGAKWKVESFVGSGNAKFSYVSVDGVHGTTVISPGSWEGSYQKALFLEDPSAPAVSSLKPGDPVPYNKLQPDMIVEHKGTHALIVAVDGDTVVYQSPQGSLLTVEKEAWDAHQDQLKMADFVSKDWSPHLVSGLKVGDTKAINGKTYRLNENHRWELVEDDQQASDTQQKLEGMDTYAWTEHGNFKLYKTNNSYVLQKKGVDGKPLPAKVKAALKELDHNGAKKLYYITHDKAAELSTILDGGVKAKPKKAKEKPQPQKVSVPVQQEFPYNQIGPQKGSNPGGLYEDSFGKKWYIKFPQSEDHAKNELLAAKLYGACGIAAPKLKLVSKDGKIGIASAFQDGLTNDAAALQKGAPGAKEGFGVDAWLANWDTAGLSFDNMPVDKDGNAVRIDVGGSLLYRAQGGPKGDAFGYTVTEIDSLRNASSNSQTASIFGKMTQEEINQSVAKVLEIPDDIIKKAVDKFGPGDQAAKDALTDKLIGRKNYLAKRFPGAMAIAFPPKPDPSSLPVKPGDFPKAPDFHNWNGPGDGLSKKPGVNQQNQDLADAIYAVATAGNLTTLKSMTYIPVGESTPQTLADHKSKHIKAMFNQCVCTLESIADPGANQAAKDWGLDTYDDGDIGDLSAACQSYQYGVTKHSVPASKRLGFWLSIQDVDGGHHLAPKEPHDVNTKEHAIGKASTKGMPHYLTSFMKAVKSSGTANDPYRDGLEYDKSGNKCRDVIKAAYEHAAEFAEGATIRKFIDFNNHEPGMMQQMLDQKPGHVFQNPGSMCCSLKPNWSWSGEAELEIVYAKGAKGLYNIGVGSYDSEGEVTTLPGQRFMIIESKKKGNKGVPWFKLLMLPPDPTYLDTLYQKKAASV